MVSKLETGRLRISLKTSARISRLDFVYGDAWDGYLCLNYIDRSPNNNMLYSPNTILFPKGFRFVIVS
jgi:hypothetical protein